MKLLIISALFVTFGASTALAKGPFEKFKGTYEVQKAPRIEKRNILHCNWLYMRNVIRVVIDSVNENEGAEVVAIANPSGETNHTFLTFVEFSKMDQKYPRRAYLSGDETAATYTVENHSDGYTWTMKNEDSKYFLNIVTYTNYTNGARGYCEYDLDLVKVN